MKIERRDFTNESVKLEEREDGSKVISGYAAVFHREGESGTEYELWPGMKERIAPQAFKRALDEKQDVRGLFNHAPDAVLGRSQAGTMRLSTDSKGLRYEIDYNANDPDHVRVSEKIKRGDVTGSSFAFRVAKGGEVRTNETRTLIDLDVVDVGPVTFPAYKGTSTGVRCHDADSLRAEMNNEKQQLLNERRKKLLDNT